MYFDPKTLQLLLVNLALALCESPIIKTIYGDVKGKLMTSRGGRIFSAFLGIPYATPPTGHLRFMPPQPPPRWQGVKSVTQEENICSQGKYGGHEDCLYINIFCHQVKNESLMPVMFYIHGGAFYMGSAELGITGPEFLMERDIVLVTVQYRLGPFGFLSTGDSVIPGNMGLKDQVMALKWVQENIQNFGGNPDEVTLFGCSVGASSVHFHMQSTMSQHLFKRGISQSGTALSAFALATKETASKYMVQLGKHLNCKTENSTEFLQCLYLKTTQEVENAHSLLKIPRYAMIGSIFRPVVEDHDQSAFITKNPYFTTTKKPWLTGITANEGILDIQDKYLNYTIKKLKEDPDSFLPKALLLEDLISDPQKIVAHILEFYFSNSSTTHKVVQSLEQMYTDCWYLWPMEQAIKRHDGILYYYVYDYLGHNSYVDVYGSPKGFGVSHLDDLISLFKHTKYFKTLNEIDTNISKLMVDLWVNFATNSDPTPLSISRSPQTDSPKDFRWEKCDRNCSKYIHIQSNLLSMKDGIYVNRVQFWKSILSVY